VHAMDVPYSFNTILVASVQPTTSEDFIRNVALIPQDAPDDLKTTLNLAVSALVPVTASETIFTDNRAPVETMVDSMVLNFLFGGGVEQLR